MIDPVTQLEQDWPREQRRLAGALAEWCAQQPPLRRFATPAQLLRFLHSASPEASDEPLLALLALARSDRRAGRFVLQAILPALKAQAARVIAEQAGREEVWELLLFFAWQAICCYPLERRRRAAANLVLQVLHDTTRELRPCQHEPAAEHPRRLASVAVAQARLAGEPRVAAAVAAGALAEREAELILRTRVDGVSLRLLARLERVGYHALRQRRQRAERRLRDFLADTDVSIRAASDLISGADVFSRRAA